jgi:hypothetical protein
MRAESAILLADRGVAVVIDPFQAVRRPALSWAYYWLAPAACWYSS